MPETKIRNHLFDNIKGIMLFLVALGHVLDIGIHSSPVMMVTMKYLYLFHMPMFAFVTGFFSKNLEKARKTAVQKALIPYLVLQSVYVAMAVIMLKAGLASFNADVFQPSILLPSSAFYYLLAVFFWKLLGPDIMKLRFPIVTSILLGLGISLTASTQFHEGYGAVFSLLVFYVLGVLCTEDTIQKIRRIPKICGVLTLLLGLLPAIYLPYSIHSVRMTYESVGFSPIEGIVYRLLFYAIAVVMGAAIINLTPEKRSWLSQIGVSSIVVYGASTFLSPHGYVILEKILHLPQQTVFRFPAMILYCAALVSFSAIPLFLKLFNQITDFCCKILFHHN